MFSIKVSKVSCWFPFSGLDEMFNRDTAQSDDMKCVSYKRNDPLGRNHQSSVGCEFSDTGAAIYYWLMHWLPFQLIILVIPIAENTNDMSTVVVSLFGRLFFWHFLMVTGDRRETGKAGCERGWHGSKKWCGPIKLFTMIWTRRTRKPSHSK